ncbi:MAG: alanine--tRNA ligase, partial [Bacteroides sp.]
MTILINDIRNLFIDFFKKKQHILVPPSSLLSPIDDNSLMFTNAGMNQFKDIFLGNKISEYKRVVNSQLCFRVSGKHNDINNVGHDLYHHTIFEMLGNWSFNDFFKKEIIEWSYELLTNVFNIEPERLFITVFDGNKYLKQDKISFNIWNEYLSKDHIKYDNFKNNFWEMANYGPCGPCSEIHIDLRSKKERLLEPGINLVNKNHPKIIELWNLVFIEYNKYIDGSLNLLENKYVDTGMGLERLSMVLQNKNSTYDTNEYQIIIESICNILNIRYKEYSKYDIAIRIVADHIKAAVLIINEGQKPSNHGAGYVIRRIIRRAIRYSYVNLSIDYNYMHNLVDIISAIYLIDQNKCNVIKDIISFEESNFLNTLKLGINRFNKYIKNNNFISGEFAFLLYDTYGFPIDIIHMMAEEKGILVDIDTFHKNLNKQKNRSSLNHKDKLNPNSDWIIINSCKNFNVHFCGYTESSCECIILKYRHVIIKNIKYYHIVINKTPFYSVQGGQINDTGTIYNSDISINVINVFKENNLIIHLCDKIPINIEDKFIASINIKNRKLISNNHTATHLLNYALKKILQYGIKQKGSFLNADYLRFDFDYPYSISYSQILDIEEKINTIITSNIIKKEYIISFKEAKQFNIEYLPHISYEKNVRVIEFNNISKELCGGTHVNSTIEIKMFKIISCKSISSGIKRIEAITGDMVYNYLTKKSEEINNVQKILKSNSDISKSVNKLINNNVIINNKFKLLFDLYYEIVYKNLIQNIIYINDKKLILSIINPLFKSSLATIFNNIIKELKNVLIVLLLYDNKNYSIFVRDSLNNDSINSLSISKKIVNEYNGSLKSINDNYCILLNTNVYDKRINDFF